MSEEKARKESLLTLFITFAKVGVMTFGGGYAMLPILEREVVVNHKWSTQEQMLDYYAIGQCTPGIISVNVASFVGYSTRGVIGEIIATLGIVFPSFLIITVLATVIRVFQDNPYVVKAFAGIRIAVCALILSAVINLVRKAVSNVTTAVIAVAALLLQLFLGLSPILIVLGAGVAGLAVYFYEKKKTGKKDDAK
ncbi:MAG: chromate transporter [Sphaerochaeta sp.]